MEIIKGRIQGAKKVVVYGPEGIGKSTFASKFPDPLFIDTEGSTKSMDVSRTKKPSSWAMLQEQVRYVRDNRCCATLVIDTMDWAEQMCIEAICDKHHKSGIEDFGYGNGYVYVKEELGRFLNLLEEVVEKGIHVVLTAHAQIRKFEQPDELGAYDRYELKLGKKTSSQTAPLVKEWADMVLFANYKTYAVAVDDKGKKHKAQGGRRVMYTTHNPCWDAKNREGLAEELPFDFGEIAHIFSGNAGHKEEAGHEEKKQEERIPEKKEAPVIPEAVPEKGKEDIFSARDENAMPEPDPAIPQALRDLMKENKVTEWDIQNVVAARGYYPSDTPVANYDPDFVAGVLVGAWPQVMDMIRQMWEKQEIPFN